MADVYLTWVKGAKVAIATSGSGAAVAQIASIIVDVTPTETHTLESEVTHFPVEQGVDITDHIRPKPRTYTISNGLVSECPVVGQGVEPDPTAAGQAYRSLVEIWENQALLTITTGIERYDNMAMTSAPVTRTAKDGNSLRFSATFEEIQIVQSQTVAVTKVRKATKTVILGPVEPQPVTIKGSLGTQAAAAFTSYTPGQGLPTP